MAFGASSPRSRPITSRRWHSFDALVSGTSASTGTRRTARSSSSSFGSPTAPERPLDVPLRVALGDVASLVALLLAATDRQFELYAAVPEVHPGWDKRQALLLHLAGQGLDLAAVEEQLSVTLGIVVGDVSLGVFVDVGADQPDLAVPQVGVGLGERDPPVS